MPGALISDSLPDKVFQNTAPILFALEPSQPPRQDASSNSSKAGCMRLHEAAAICREPWFRTVDFTKSSKTRLPVLFGLGVIASSYEVCPVGSFARGLMRQPPFAGSRFRTFYQTKSSKTQLPSCLPLDPASQVARLQGRTRPHATSKTPASFGAIN